jgi:hypothetical protein
MNPTIESAWNEFAATTPNQRTKTRQPTYRLKRKALLSTPALLLLTAACGLLAACCVGHPGSGIVVDAQGNVFVSDINRGLIKFGADGKVAVVLKEAGHWLALDSAEKFREVEFEKSDHWPRWFKHRTPPGAGLALISDGGSPLVVHSDGNLYYVCNDERMVPGGLEIGRLSPDGKLALVSPQMKGRVEELGGLKGLASGPDGSLYATCPGAVLKVKLDGTFSTVKHPIAVPDCERYLPPNTPAAHEPFLTGLAVDSRGNIFLAATGCRCVLKLNADGQISMVLKAEPPWSPTGVALHGENLYVVEWTNAHSDAHDYRPRVRQVGRDGKVTTLATFPE